MSNVNKNITVEAKLISPLTYFCSTTAKQSEYADAFAWELITLILLIATSTPTIKSRGLVVRASGY
jgi:hypothetical protein